LLGHNAFQLREHGTVSVSRLVAAGLALALVPAALVLPSLLSLAAVAALLATLAAFETVRARTLRQRLRAR
jgi:hypothetical protein